MALTSAGLTLPTVEEILADIVSDQETAIGDQVETGASSPLGQLNAVVANQARVVQELAAAVYAAGDPDTAEGAALERLCALTGTYRRAATYSTVEVTVTLAATTSKASGSIIGAVAGATDRRFVLSEDIENASGVEDDVVGTFTAEVSGPVEASAGTLTVLAEPSTGVVALTNAADATLGEVEETDIELRERRRDELARPGTATVDAIRVDVMDSVVDADGAELLEDVVVFMNTSDVTDGDGLPPHSVEVLAYDGTPGGTAATNAQIAAAVFAAVAAGIETYGTTSTTTLDARGVARDVSFSRPDVVEIDIEIDIETGPDYTSDIGDAIKAAVAAYGQTNLTVGSSVYRSRLYCPIFDASVVPDEVVNISEIRMSRLGDPTIDQDLAMGVRELPVIDTANIAIQEV